MQTIGFYITFTCWFHCFFFSRGDEVMVNREVGHLMRTKSTAHEDGGVSSGRANLDSPFLV